MLEIKLFTAERFESRKKAEKLLNFFAENGGPFVPSKFDDAEPIKRPFNSANMNEAADLLAGDPDHRSGGIMLKGDKFKSQVWVHWSDGEPFQTWYLFLAPAFFKKKGATKVFLKFIQDLVVEVQFTFGAAASREEWRAKHYLITESEIGTSERKLGITLDRCVPGVYWCTIFGKELTAFFGRSRLLKLPIEQAVDLEAAGTLLQISQNPFDSTKEILNREKEIIETLGPEHFFDINDPEKSCSEIAKVLFK